MSEILGAVARRHKHKDYLRYLILSLARWTCPEEATTAYPGSNDPGRHAPRIGDMENKRDAPFRTSCVASNGNTTNATDRVTRKANRSNVLDNRGRSIKFGKGGRPTHSPVWARQARPAGQRGVLSAHTGRDETARTGLFINGF